MTISALPTPPARSDTEEVFIARADAFLAALAAFAAEANATAAAMNLNSTTDTSASSVAIGTGAKSFTVSAGKSFLGGMFLIFADAAAPSTNWMFGQVTSYAGTALVSNVLAVGGSGTKASWLISQSAPGGAALGVNPDITQLTAINAPSIPAVGLMTSAVANVPMLNGYVDWTISGNALTAAVKTLAGTDPSATDPVFAVFRDPTLTNGGYFVRSITAALSVTASSGSTLGTVSAQASRIRAVLMDNAGTVVLGLYNPWNDTTKSLVGLNEGAVYSSTAEGGAGAADSAQVIYTTAAQASKAIREVSYMDSTQTTAGTWAQALTNKVQITASTPKTGAVLQFARNVVSAVATGTTLIPADNTIPQSGEGDQYMSQAVTFSSASNIYRLDAMAQLTHATAGVTLTGAIFQDAVANALAANIQAFSASSHKVQEVHVEFVSACKLNTATTFKYRGGSDLAGTTTFNGAAGVGLFGGAMFSHLEIQEIMV